MLRKRASLLAATIARVPADCADQTTGAVVAAEERTYTYDLKGSQAPALCAAAELTLRNVEMRV